jgi:ubiquitin-activating enzyme E1 C
VKNIIPAIASTNAIIAAACCNEAFKIATSCNPYLDNYMMYTGNDSVYTYTFEHRKKESCPVCGNIADSITVDGKLTLEEFIASLNERAETKTKSPSLRTAKKSLYLQSPPQLEETTRPNLLKSVEELFDSGEEVVITDPMLPFSLRVQVYLR